jgi:hypothetical protein
MFSSYLRTDFFRLAKYCRWSRNLKSVVCFLCKTILLSCACAIRGIRCPAPRCTSKVQPELVKDLVREELWQIYDQRLLGKPFRGH